MAGEQMLRGGEHDLGARGERVKHFSGRWGEGGEQILGCGEH